MASKLKDARDQIATDWAAITPPTTPRRTYQKLTGRDILDGASGHRTFYFSPPFSAVVSEFAADFTVYRYEFDAKLRLSSAGVGIDGTFDQIVDESMLLVDSVNARSSWPAGVRMVSAESYNPEEIDSDDFEITIPLIAEIEET
tara:strand:+ start:1015 stop:1446 length:432 start_codon:yes stop_codon:yes gene_type:complete